MGSTEMAVESDDMTATEFWVSVLGDEGPMLGLAVQMFDDVPNKVYEEALGRLSREEAFGCLQNPTAYINGNRFGNIVVLKHLIDAMWELSLARRKFKSEWRG